jgi:hypothetical protein
VLDAIKLISSSAWPLDIISGGAMPVERRNVQGAVMAIESSYKQELGSTSKVEVTDKNEYAF